MSDEMRLRIVDYASRVSYSEAASMASPSAPISKSTVARIVADVRVEAEAKPRRG